MSGGPPDQQLELRWLPVEYSYLQPSFEHAAGLRSEQDFAPLSAPAYDLGHSGTGAE